MTRKGGEALFYGGCAAGVKVPVDARRVHYEALTLKGAFHFRPSDRCARPSSSSRRRRSPWTGSCRTSCP